MAGASKPHPGPPFPMSSMSLMSLILAPSWLHPISGRPACVYRLGLPPLLSPHGPHQADSTLRSLPTPPGPCHGLTGLSLVNVRPCARPKTGNHLLFALTPSLQLHQVPGLRSLPAGNGGLYFSCLEPSTAFTVATLAAGLIRTPDCHLQPSGPSHRTCSKPLWLHARPIQTAQINTTPHTPTYTHTTQQRPPKQAASVHHQPYKSSALIAARWPFPFLSSIIPQGSTLPSLIPPCLQQH
ncbi:hypothetical protein B0J11DRAFT_93415 [Dendryphion nanum]|uniref:Uncharacterized protein n=1 Tax=Dendryphion nanum TaxID=256645 RepID=A0A9P9DF76_9PLEO|nr:hypothetical protein B0J11DRAFT_93415 [Dendryphion nanum]